MRSPTPFLVAVLAAVAAAVAVPSTAAAAEPLTVLAYETPPFFYREGGQIKGLEHDILKYHAKASGQELRVVWIDDFDSLLDRLRRGEGDVVAGTLTITPERRRIVDFSDSYFPVRVILVEPKGEATRNLTELRGATVATMPGTTYEELLRQIPDVRMDYGGNERELMEMVARGEARAAAVDSGIALPLLAEFPALRLGIALSEEQNYGFAVADGSPLAAGLSKTLSQLKASKIYFRLLEEHLGEEAVRVLMAAKQ